MVAAALSSRTVVVTGAGGFIGSHVTRALVTAGAGVHAFVRRAGSDRLRDVDDRIVETVLDVGDPEAIRSRIVAAAPDVVVHLAADTAIRRAGSDWSSVQRSLDVNVRGTVNVVHAALEAGARTVVRVGGLEEYGAAPTPFHEDEREQPISAYSASQVAATYYCEFLQRHSDATIITLRPALTYGPAQSTEFFIPALIDSCLRNEPFAMSDGEQRRDLLFIEDLVDAVLAAIANPPNGGAIVNVGTGTEHRIIDVGREIARLTGADESLLEIGAKDRPALNTSHLVAVNDRAAELLGWHASTSLHDGLAATVEWYRRAAPRGGGRGSAS